MKKMKWISGLLLIALIMVITAPTVFAAAPSETVTVYFTKSDIYGIDGTFSFSNPELFTSVSYSTSGMAGSAANNKVYLYSADKANVSIGVTVTINPAAADGDSCVITFNYQTSDIDGNMTSGTASQTVTVSVPSDPGKPEQPEDPGKPSDPGKPEEPKDEVKADTTELERQITIAEGLNSSEYTAESWKALSTALDNARALLKSTDQKKVDKAAADLSSAIKNLVKMDYSKLQAAIDSAKVLTDTDEVGQKYTALIGALSESIEALASNDQAAVDAAAEKLETMVAELQSALDELREANIVEVEKTVEVEVEPKSPFCNISIHKVWPVLFFISLAVNIALIALIVVFVVRKKRAQVDTTPLVDYDIGDDEL